MRRRSPFVVAATVAACLVQANASYAVSASDPHAAAPSTADVLDDIAAALAEQRPRRALVGGDVGDPTESVLPKAGTGASETDTGAGLLTMEVPARGRDLVPSDDATAVFGGTAPDTAVVVQGTTVGVRALVHIDSADAPERFDFPLGGSVASLRLTDDGGVDALDGDGEVIAAADAPWATDAIGRAVPTHYEVSGTTLTQVVEHRTGDYSYGIVADPSIFAIAKCAFAVGLFIAENSAALGKIPKAIRFLKDTKHLMKVLNAAQSLKDAVRILTAEVGNLAGVTDVVGRCT